MTNQRPLQQDVEPLDPPLDPSKFATTKYTWQDLKDIIANDNFPIYRHFDQETAYRLYSRQLKKEWKSVCDFVLHCKFNFARRLIPVNENNNSHKKDVILLDQKCEYDKRNLDAVGVHPDEPLQPSTNYGWMKKDNLPTLPIIPPPPNGYKWESYSPPLTSEDTASTQEPQRILAVNDFPYYMEDNIEHWCLWKLGGGDVDDQDIQWAKDKLNARDDILEMQHWINPVQYKSLPDIDHAHIICLKQ